MEESVPANVLSAALYARYRSRSEQYVRREAALGDAPRLRRACRNAAIMARKAAKAVGARTGRSRARLPRFVIFGGAGDLSRRLLTPALVNLTRDGLIGDDLDILVVSHGPEDGGIVRRNFEEHLDLADKEIKAAWRHAQRQARQLFTEASSTIPLDLCRISPRSSRTIDNIAFYLATAAKLFWPDRARTSPRRGCSRRTRALSAAS